MNKRSPKEKQGYQHRVTEKRERIKIKDGEWSNDSTNMEARAASTRQLLYQMDAVSI
jgi:hypothetical protein